MIAREKTKKLLVYKKKTSLQNMTVLKKINNGSDDRETKEENFKVEIKRNRESGRKIRNEDKGEHVPNNKSIRIVTVITFTHVN